MTQNLLDQTFDAPSLDLPWQQDIVALRRDFHEHPELGFEEVRTAGIVADRLRALGLEVKTGLGVTGVVGILKGGKPGPVVLVRADMDALPVMRKTTGSGNRASRERCTPAATTRIRRRC
jgi:metal-dependent amidase/aminoacylase/carboxypeptidase family protein